MGFQPHGSRYNLTGRNRQAAITQTCAVKIQPRNVQTLADCDGFCRRCNEFSGTCIIGQTACDIARHGGEHRAGFLQHGEIVVGPVPNATLETHFGQALEAPIERLVGPQHFSAGGEREG